MVAICAVLDRDLSNTIQLSRAEPALGCIRTEVKTLAAEAFLFYTEFCAFLTTHAINNVVVFEDNHLAQGEFKVVHISSCNIDPYKKIPSLATFSIGYFLHTY